MFGSLWFLLSWKQGLKLEKLWLLISNHLRLIFVSVIIWLSVPFVRDSGLISYKSDRDSRLASGLVVADCGLEFYFYICSGHCP